MNDTTTQAADNCRRSPEPPPQDLKVQDAWNTLLKLLASEVARIIAEEKKAKPLSSPRP